MEPMACISDDSGGHKMTAESFNRFAQFITQQLGIKMSADKIPMLQSRLQRRLRALHLSSLDEYKNYLFDSEKSGEELVDFIDAVTTNKTDFFREPSHFDYLVQTVLPNLDPKGSQQGGYVRKYDGNDVGWRFKLWCAGCSSGEEPYTLAMVLSEYTLTRPGFDFAILATDVSTRVLQHAEAAIYDEARVTPVEISLRKKYLLRSKDPSKSLVRIVPALRNKVSFHRLNFMDEQYPVRDQFEVIFFRNVMIYFSKPTQEAVIHRLCDHLKPGGYLFVGHSESLAGLKIPVMAVSTAVYRKPL